MRAISYGAGVQSTAMLVLAARREIDYPLAIFANVGDDSENPATIAYFRDYAKPYAAAHGIEMVEVAAHETLYKSLVRRERSVHIPVRMDGGGAPGRRGCTYAWKRVPVARELKRRGATTTSPAELGIGISVDEYQRMRIDSGFPHMVHTHPLIDLRMDRQDCLTLIADAGLPVPEKSSCYFCPLHNQRDWQELHDKKPDLFQKSVDLEALKNTHRTAMGKDSVWFSSADKPLDQAFTETGQIDMFEDDALTCLVAGYCGS